MESESSSIQVRGWQSLAEDITTSVYKLEIEGQACINTISGGRGVEKPLYDDMP